MDDVPTRLLAPDEPQPVTLTNEGGMSPFIIVAEWRNEFRALSSKVRVCPAGASATLGH
jgi:hypothetical protein